MSVSDQDLVFLMGEELKRPLTLIKSLAEDASSDAQLIRDEARKALRTIDNVLLYRRLVSEQLTLAVAPVHLGSTITQVAQTLRPLTQSFGCETEIIIQSGATPVDADSEVLRAGVESLWQAILGMTTKESVVTWRLQRKHNGVRVVVTNKTIDVSSISLAKTGSVSRQPFKMLAGPATDLLVAQGLLTSFGGRFSKYSSKQGSGFSIFMPSSPQLAFV